MQDISDYVGLIVRLATTYWRKLPPEHQRWLDPDDMVQHGIVHFYVVQRRFKPSRKVLFSTFLYTALENYYRQLLERLRTKKRTALLIDIDECVEPVHFSLDQMEAERKVNRLLELASRRLVTFLRDAYFGGRTHTQPSEELIQEFRLLCIRTKTTPYDFRLVRAASIR